MNNLIEKQKKTVVISLGTIVTLTFLLRAIFKRKNRKSKLPIVPYSLPFIGSTRQYHKNPRLFIKTNTAKYGDTFIFHLHGAFMNVVGPQDITDIFKNNNFSFLTSKMKFIGPSFLIPEGNLPIPPIVTRDIVRKHIHSNIDVYGVRIYKKLQEIVEMNTQDTFIVEDMFSYSNDLVSRSMAIALLGSSLGQREDLIYTCKVCVGEVKKELKPSLMRVLFPFINSIYIRFFRPRSSEVIKHRSTITEAIKSEIVRKKKPREAGQQTQEIYLLDHILETYPGEMNEDYLAAMTAIILMLIFVGFNTTATNTSYALYQLVMHPEYVEELRQEQQDILWSNPNQEFVSDISKKMVKLDSFIRESLRHRFSSMGIVQTNIGKEDIQLPSGAIVSPGEEVAINFWKVHCDQTGDEPYAQNSHEFQGFRYLHADKVSTQISSDYLAFGLGRHACPGRWFAVHEMKGIISTILRNYDLTPASPIRRSQRSTEFHGAVRFTKRV